MNYFVAHFLEIFTTILGVFYLYYEYKASIWLWFLGIIMPLIDIYLFSINGMYAYSFISLIFVIVAIYGFLNWKYGGVNHTEKYITYIKFKTLLLYSVYFFSSLGLFFFLLTKYTNSEVRFLDSTISAFSLVGTIALAYKYIEQWLIWIIVDILSVILFIHQGLYFRAILYFIYVIVAIQGYKKWKTMI